MQFWSWFRTVGDVFLDFCRLFCGKVVTPALYVSNWTLWEQKIAEKRFQMLYSVGLWTDKCGPPGKSVCAGLSKLRSTCPEDYFWGTYVVKLTILWTFCDFELKIVEIPAKFIGSFLKTATAFQVSMGTFWRRSFFILFYRSISVFVVWVKNFQLGTNKCLAELW